jgi:hypothetical protein
MDELDEKTDELMKLFQEAQDWASKGGTIGGDEFDARMIEFFVKRGNEDTNANICLMWLVDHGKDFREKWKKDNPDKDID